MNATQGSSVTVNCQPTFYYTKVIYTTSHNEITPHTMTIGQFKRTEKKKC